MDGNTLLDLGLGGLRAGGGGMFGAKLDSVLIIITISVISIIVLFLVV